MPIINYAFDPTGVNPDNRVIDEVHTVSSPGWMDFYFIVPRYAPFFRNSLTITLVETGTALVEGVDWLPSHRFISASRGTLQPIYGSISFLNKTLSGVIKVSYQTLGGDWVLDETKILEIANNTNINPKTTTWEQVLDVPDVAFPPIDHMWAIDDMVGMSEVRQALDNIATAILNSGGEGGVASDHILDFNNPHQTTKAHVGLGNVSNYPTATLNQALNPANDQSFLTPNKLHAVLTEFGITYDPLNNRVIIGGGDL